MVFFHWTFLFHILGIGLIFASLLGGLVIHFRFRGTRDWKSRAVILPVARIIGLFSPAGTALLLLSGIGNIVALSLSPMPFWMHLKLGIFVVLVVLGVWGAVLARKRAGLVMSLSTGNPSPDAEAKLRSAEAFGSSVFIVQGFLFLAVIAISVIKP
jgi:hypothetical protein